MTDYTEINEPDFLKETLTEIRKKWAKLPKATNPVKASPSFGLEKEAGMARKHHPWNSLR